MLRVLERVKIFDKWHFRRNSEQRIKLQSISWKQTITGAENPNDKEPNVGTSTYEILFY